MYRSIVQYSIAAYPLDQESNMKEHDEISKIANVETTEQMIICEIIWQLESLKNFDDLYRRKFHVIRYM